MSPPAMDQPPDGPISSIAEPGVKAEGSLLYSMRKEVAELLGRHQIGFAGAQPVSFARTHLEELTKQEYDPSLHDYSCLFAQC